MSKALCANCRSAQEVRSMTLCPQCGQYICSDCIRQSDGECPNCLEEMPDADERRGSSSAYSDREL